MSSIKIKMIIDLVVAALAVLGAVVTVVQQDCSIAGYCLLSLIIVLQSIELISLEGDLEEENKSKR